MGKATIVDGGTDGLYTIRIDRGKAVIDARIAKVAQKIAKLDTEIATAVTEEATAYLAEQSALIAVNFAVQTYNLVSSDPETTDEQKAAAKKAMSEASAAYMLKRSVYETAQAKLRGLRAQRAKLDAERTNLQALETEREIEAWCADLTEDAAGEVATIEVPGEPAAVLIAPAGDAPTDADGYLLMREAMPPEQAYYNAAILPGWQAFKPTFRFGEVLDVDADADTCTVRLDAAQSSAQQLGINQDYETLLAVPIEYMTCNAAVFESGDRVVVRFDDQDWTKPKVIGFENNPKACEGPVVLTMKLEQIVPFGFGGTTVRRFRHLVYDLRKGEVTEQANDLIIEPYDFRYPHIIQGYINQLYTRVSATEAEAPLGYRTIRFNVSAPFDVGQKIISPCFDFSRKEVVCIDEPVQTTIKVFSEDYATFIREFSTWPEAGNTYTVSAHKGRVAMGGWIGGAYGIQVVNHVTGELLTSINLGADYIHEVTLTQGYVAVSCYNEDNDAYLRLYDPDTGLLLAEELLGLSDSKWFTVTAQGAYIAIMRNPAITWVGGTTATGNNRVRFFKYTADDGLVFIEEKTDLFTDWIAEFAEDIIAGGGSPLIPIFARVQSGR